MAKHYKARWRQAEADLRDLCQSNSAQARPSHLSAGDTTGTPTAPYWQERQLQLETKALRQAHIEEQQASALAQERELAIQEFRRQAEEQLELLKLQWRCQLSQEKSMDMGMQRQPEVVQRILQAGSECSLTSSRSSESMWARIE